MKSTTTNQDWTEPQLEELGFKKHEWTDEGENFSEMFLDLGRIKIEISGVSLVEIVLNKEWLTVPNCKTLADIKDLIRLFKSEK